MRETCLIVDGHSLMHRAYHALPPMDQDGVPTNAVHGFLAMLLKAFNDYEPQYCVVAFDEHGPTFRHEHFPAYKEGRAPMAEDLRPQFAVLQEILSAMGIGVVSKPGYEADDLLGTISLRAQKDGIDSLLLTGDRDALQLVGDGVSLLFTRRGISDIVHFDPEQVKETYGVTPEQVPDWKGLMGDASDNIPGVPGVGDKTAVKLLQEYGSVDNVLAHAEDIKGKLGERLRDNREQALSSRMLATIDRNVPITYQLSDWRLTRLDQGLPVLQKYGLNTASERVRRIAEQNAPDNNPPQPEPSPWQAWEQPQSAADVAAFSENADELSVHITGTELTLARPDKRRLKMEAAPYQLDMLSTAGPLTMEEALSALTKTPHSIAAHDAKTLFHRMRKAGAQQPALAWDTMIAAYLHNPQEKSFALEQFAAPDASGVHDLRALQVQQLKDEGMTALYHEIELPLVQVLYDMEVVGFQVDTQVLTELGQVFTERTTALQEDIFRHSGVAPFNVNSPQQLGKVLFEDLGLPFRRKTKSGYSTDADTLESISDLHPIVPLILEYRQYAKLNSTYIDPMLRKVEADGRIHTTFDQTGTATGRISSAEPNLQNIPVRTPLGRDIRRAFVSAPGYVLVDADYSQIELRVLAHMSQDEAMCDAFNQGHDIHTRTAAAVAGIDMEEVTPQMRSAAKAVNFGIVYGISDFGLARNIGITRAEARDFINRYFERYPGVKAYMDKAVRDGYANEYAQTLFGRRRYLTELTSRNATLRNFGERAAMNTPIQGTAADIIKAAMVRVHAELAKGDTGARLILQVHDELLVEAPEQQADNVAKILKSCMEQVVSMRVPLISDVRIGRSWYETK